MPRTKADTPAGRFYGLLGSVAANRARILLPILAVVLIATGCGDDGGGGY